MYGSISAIHFSSISHNCQALLPPDDRVPGDAGEGDLERDLVLEGPLRQVHDVGRLVDPDDPVRADRGEHEAQDLGAELDVRHGGTRVHHQVAADLEVDRMKMQTT